MSNKTSGIVMSHPLNEKLEPGKYVVADWVYIDDKKDPGDYYVIDWNNWSYLNPEKFSAQVEAMRLSMSKPQIVNQLIAMYDRLVWRVDDDSDRRYLLVLRKSWTPAQMVKAILHWQESIDRWYLGTGEEQRATNLAQPSKAQWDKFMDLIYRRNPGGGENIKASAFMSLMTPYFQFIVMVDDPYFSNSGWHLIDREGNIKDSWPIGDHNTPTTLCRGANWVELYGEFHIQRENFSLSAELRTTLINVTIYPYPEYCSSRGNNDPTWVRVEMNQRREFRVRRYSPEERLSLERLGLELKDYEHYLSPVDIRSMQMSGYEYEWHRRIMLGTLLAFHLQAKWEKFLGNPLGSLPENINHMIGAAESVLRRLQIAADEKIAQEAKANG